MTGLVLTSRPSLVGLVARCLRATGGGHCARASYHARDSRRASQSARVPSTQVECRDQLTHPYVRGARHSKLLVHPMNAVIKNAVIRGLDSPENQELFPAASVDQIRSLHLAVSMALQHAFLAGHLSQRLRTNAACRQGRPSPHRRARLLPARPCLAIFGHAHR